MLSVWRSQSAVSCLWWNSYDLLRTNLCTIANYLSNSLHFTVARLRQREMKMNCILVAGKWRERKISHSVCRRFAHSRRVLLLLISKSFVFFVGCYKFTDCKLVKIITKCSGDREEVKIIFLFACKNVGESLMSSGRPFRTHYEESRFSVSTTFVTFARAGLWKCRHWQQTKEISIF